VVKNGAEPAFVAAKDAQGWVAPKPGAKSVDPTGAGDSFNGAYLAARAQGASPLEAAEHAHSLAAIVIGHKGALVPHEKLVP
jgi:2-dehydro-3-deoxygluconokinase